MKTPLGTNIYTRKYNWHLYRRHHKTNAERNIYYIDKAWIQVTTAFHTLHMCSSTSLASIQTMQCETFIILKNIDTNDYKLYSS